VFSLQFIPSLMYAYLSGIAQGDKQVLHILVHTVRISKLSYDIT